MVERTSAKVRRYCEAHGITIPVGFGRHPANRYVVIELSDPPKLIARTWFTHADVIHYLERLAGDTPKRILDFQDQQELVFEGGKRLKRIGEFEAA